MDNTQPRLRNRRKGKVIAIATSVIGLECVDADRDCPAFGKIAEGARSIRRTDITDHGKNGAGWQHGITNVGARKLCAVDRHAIHNNSASSGVVAIYLDVQHSVRGRMTDSSE